MTYLSTPLKATGWKNTLVNDAEGNTILLMPNAHKGLEAVKEATALIAAAPDMLAALEFIAPQLGSLDIYEYERVKIRAAIAKARGELA